MGYDVEKDLQHLIEELQRLNEGSGDEVKVKFGTLFKDDRCTNIFEALAGTLKTAKKRKIVTFQGELLLQGMSDNVDIILLEKTLD